MPLNSTQARALLREAKFRSLFIEELGWDRYNATLNVQVQGASVALSAIAEKRGMVAYHCPTPTGQEVPDYGLRRKIEHQVAKSTLEHLIVFTDPGSSTQIWQWIKREPGKPAACREHTYHRSQSGDALLQKLEGIAFSLEEEDRLTLTDVTSAARAAFDVERVTKRFYERFKQEHTVFLNFVKGITDTADREWYASVMLNRLMFVYFIQRKGFLDGDPDYLRNRLNQMRKEHGRDKFYSFYRYFLLRLFHEGLGGRERSSKLEKLLGRIPYLNGGLFDIHELEQHDRYGKSIEISDAAFERVFDYFDQYQWHLDERPLRDDKEINPDVLGYIFEKYINQKQMGAYYTKEDITEYITKNSVIPFLLDAVRAKCKIAFENPNGPTTWDLLRADPNRYIYPAVRHGITWRYDPGNVRQGETLERPLQLPPEIATGFNPASLHQTAGEGPVLTLELRKRWNKPAPAEFALPTETWREVASRRKRHDELRAKLVGGEVRDVNELITLNLDIRQFAQDAIENCEGPELLRAFWRAIEGVTILDPTCGSGAFLFAALNILEPLYDACLERMEAFVEDLDRSREKHGPEKYADFRKVLANVEAHPNRRYFILKSIILRNLYGVDIMEEAVEICKLRLFLKLAAQVEPDAKAKNVGIEPLPDIDFNVRAGNSLVGYSTYEAAKSAIERQLDLDNVMERIAAKAADLQQTFDTFRQNQIEGDGSVPAEHKQELRRRLEGLEAELNRHLATEYGARVSDKSAYHKWLKSHQPFHWFVEFYRIITDGGFDVIIGNPPYLEYSKVKKYTVRHYATERCANLYAFTVERSLSLCNRRGRLSMIIPISIACSGAMESLRKEFATSTRTVWLSHFSNRPGQLFTGAQNRLSIFVTTDKHTNPQEFSTRYHRWDGRNGERGQLFAALRYQELSKGASIFHGLLPKVGSCDAASAMEKLRSNKSVKLYTTRGAHNKLYWVRVPGYFCQFLTRPPMARPETGGAARVRGEVNEICFNDKLPRDVIHAILNSSTYYQFFCVYTDTRHINPSDVAEFPLNFDALDERARTKLSALSVALARCFNAHTTQWRKSGLLIDSVDSRLCKPVLDEVDRVLAEHYAFTEEELDFIINYDIKYRMGGNSEAEEDGLSQPAELANSE